MCGPGPAGTVEDHCARLLSARVQRLDLPAALGYSPGGEALIDETGAHELATMRCRAMLWRTNPVSESCSSPRRAGPAEGRAEMLPPQGKASNRTNTAWRYRTGCASLAAAADRQGDPTGVPYQPPVGAPRALAGAAGALALRLCQLVLVHHW